MPETSYIASVLAIGFAITFALRAVPFAVLEPLRHSRFVTTMAAWMPAGILAILAVSTLSDSVGTSVTIRLAAASAVAVTVAVHLLSGRRTLWSVGTGTLVYIVAVNLG